MVVISDRAERASAAERVVRTSTAQPGHDHDVCPACGTELCGGHILDWMKGDKEKASHYGWPDKLCGSQRVGIELPYDDPNHYDGVSYWHYLCCGAVYDRFTGLRQSTEEITG